MKWLINRLLDRLYYDPMLRWRYVWLHNSIPISDALNKKLRDYAKSRLIYIHIPKCGGTSVAKALYKKGLISQEDPGHYTAIELYKADIKVKNKCFVAVLRSPVDRFISAFFYLANGGGNEYDRLFFESRLRPYKKPADLLRAMKESKSVEKCVLSWIHFVPMARFIDNIDPARLKIYTIRELDRLARDYELEINHVNRTKVDYDRNLDVESELYLRAIYSEDFTLYDNHSAL